MATLRLGILASGRGSNFMAIISAIAAGKLDAEVCVLISNRKGAGALEIASKSNIPAVRISPKIYPIPGDFDATVEKVLEEYQVNFVALAGYLRYLTHPLIKRFKNKILNIHPALLPSFGGKGMYGLSVHEAVLDRGCKISGATVHLVDEVYDHGPIIIQESVPVLLEDTAGSLAARLLLVEHKIYPQALQLFAEDRVRIDGLRALILPG